jgi:hypothetical protein
MEGKVLQGIRPFRLQGPAEKAAGESPSLPSLAHFREIRSFLLAPMPEALILPPAPSSLLPP